MEDHVFVMRCKECNGAFWIHDSNPEYLDAEFVEDKEKYEAQGYTCEIAQRDVDFCRCR